MNERETRRSGYPLTIPDALLHSNAMRRACATRDFREIFRLVNRRTGTSHAAMASAIGKMTSSRVSDVIRGVRGIRGEGVIERVADGFGIPGELLGLPKRSWEVPQPETGEAVGKPSSLRTEPDCRDAQPGENSADSSESSDVTPPVDRRTFVSVGATLTAAATRLERGHRVIEALEILSGDQVGILPQVLGELVDHYTRTICSASPTDVYEELLAVRTYASRFLDAPMPEGKAKDLTVSIGWLSCLLGIAACDLGAHAAAHIWCNDAERRSQEARHPALSGWAMLTQSLISYYQGRPRQSVDLAARGQNLTAEGTLVHARLATQEMRAAAMTGDAERTRTARRHATEEIAKLPSDVCTTGAFSISVGEDPPYTATSLMLLGHHDEAVSATHRVIDTFYAPEARRHGAHPAGYARTLLILALAQAGTGNLDEAVSAGHAALSGGTPAWPTAALARKLDHVLEREFAGSSQVGEYRARYLETCGQLA